VVSVSYVVGLRSHWCCSPQWNPLCKTWQNHVIWTSNYLIKSFPWKKRQSFRHRYAQHCNNPKSIVFKAAVFANRKFSSLRSRCIMPCLWHIWNVTSNKPSVSQVSSSITKNNTRLVLWFIKKNFVGSRNFENEKTNGTHQLDSRKSSHRLGHQSSFEGDQTQDKTIHHQRRSIKVQQKTKTIKTSIKS